MKLKAKYILRTVADKIVAIAIEQGGNDTDGVITLNETGAFLWKLLEQDTNVDEMTAALLNEYEADEETARADILAFCDRLDEVGILE